MLKRLGYWLFKFYCHPDFQEDIEGDLEERYTFNLDTKSKRYADYKFLIDVLLLFRISLLKDNWFSQNSNSITMIQNNLSIAGRSMIRHLKGNPFSTALNIFGLTLCLTASLFIFLFLNQELSYDQSHHFSDRIYRISSSITEPDDKFKWAESQLSLPPVLAQRYTEVEQFVRFLPFGRSKFTRNNQAFFINEFYMVDSTLTSVFSLEFVYGNHREALQSPNSIIISRKTSEILFGKTNPVGELIENDHYQFIITGVYRDFPPNSHIIPEAMASLSTMGSYYGREVWDSFNMYNYLLLTENTNPQILEEKINKEIIPEFVDREFKDHGVSVAYELINLEDIHLFSDFENEPEPVGNLRYIFLFSLLTLFLLAIGAINHTNLTSAQALKRSREIGIRKILGERKRGLSVTLIIESILLSFSALALAVFVLIIISPTLNQMLNIQVDVSVIFRFDLLLIVLTTTLLTGLLSGIYPAFYLTNIRSIEAIQGNTPKSAGNSLKKILIGFQFGAALFMLICTLTIYRQIQFVRNADLGFNKDNLVSFYLNREAKLKWEVLRNEIKSITDVLHVATASHVPGQEYWKELMKVETSEGIMQDRGVNRVVVDLNYFKTLDVSFIAGRDFSTLIGSDTVNAIIVNEAMAERMGWKNPIGKRIKYSWDSAKYHNVIGVINNYHQRSLHEPIESQIFHPKSTNSEVLVRINGDTKAIISNIRKIWQKIVPGTPFEYQFLDQRFQKAYVNDLVQGRLFFILSVIIIFVTLLGLIGLTAFTSRQREREISIRKVLGASRNSLIYLMTHSFLKLLIISAVPGFALSYYAMNQWLVSFEYRTNVEVVIFLIALMSMATITFGVTAFQAFKVSSVNPVKNLE